MGLFKKKSKTVTNQNTTSTSTPILPPGVSDNIIGLGNRVNETFGAIDPKAYVPGANPLQTQAATAAAGLTTPAGYGQSNDILTRAAGAGPNTYSATNVKAASLLDGLDRYMSPYTKDVVDTSLADFDFDAGKTRAQDQLGLAADSTFGGSSGALTKSFTSDALARARGSLSAGLRDSAFNTGAGLSATDAGFRQQADIFNAGAANQAGQFNAGQLEAQLRRSMDAASGLSSNATAQGVTDRANIGTQMDAGGVMRDIQSQQNSASIDLLMKQIAAQSGIPYDLLKSVTTTGNANGTSNTTSSGLDIGAILKAAAQAAATAAVASDVRLKQDIEPIGYDAKGRRWYEYAYVWDPETRHRGVMAQEVIHTDPEAVMMHPLGFLMVDYSKLED